MSSYIVRYGAMRFLGVFSTTPGQEYLRGMRVIARTDRGLEAGDILFEANESTLAMLKEPAEGQILRQLNAEDALELDRIRQQADRELEVCQGYITKLALQMQLIDIEHIFGGERIVVFYLADSRVDFRELVKLLASEFQTRIEMRQIGVRDEAKLLADFGDCGQPVCCNTHLVQMPPVSMKMAKLQKATLDPTKISGRCGRLKCCLRYEFDTYEQLQKDMPPLGTQVVTPEGPGKVIGQEILTGQLLVLTEDQRRVLVGVEVATVTAPPSEDVREKIEEEPLPEEELRIDAMLDPSDPLAELLRKDRRYSLEAYAFVVEEALAYAKKLFRTDPEGPRNQVAPRDPDDIDPSEDEEADSPRRHVSGQELCEAIRRLALEQYGYMAKTVLNSWGIHGTSDVGEIVFNLIRIGQMGKTAKDHREDFNDVFDFDTALREDFRIHLPE